MKVYNPKTMETAVVKKSADPMLPILVDIPHRKPKRTQTWRSARRYLLANGYVVQLSDCASVKLSSGRTYRIKNNASLAIN